MSGPPSDDGLVWALSELMGAWSRQFDALQAVLQQGSTELLDSFTRIDGLQGRWKALSLDDEAGRAAVMVELSQASERALHGLQFADRLGQMLDVLHQDVNRLRAEVGSLRDADPSTLQRWLDELAARYTTDEQRERHAGSGGAAAPEAGQTGVDFF